MKRNAKKGYRVIKVLTAEEAKAIRTVELRGAAAAHAEIGEAKWAEHYAAKAAKMSKR